MKGIISTILGLVFVISSLLSLMVAERSSENSLLPVAYDQVMISEIGLQLALQRAERAPLRLRFPQSNRSAATQGRTPAKRKDLQFATFSSR